MNQQCFSSHCSQDSFPMALHERQVAPELLLRCHRRHVSSLETFSGTDDGHQRWQITDKSFREMWIWMIYPLDICYITMV